MCLWEGQTAALRGKVLFGGSLVFRTSLAVPYPPALGFKYGELMAEALKLRSEALAHSLAVPYAGAPEGHCLEDPPQEAMEAEMLEGSHEAPELVPNCLGAQMGLEPLQHVAWTGNVEHPAAHFPDKVTSKLLGALEFEGCSEVEEIEVFLSPFEMGIHMGRNI